MSDAPISVAFAFPGVPVSLRERLRPFLDSAGISLVEGVQLAPQADVGVFDICEKRHPVTGGVTGWGLLRGGGARCRRLVAIGGAAAPADLAGRTAVVASDVTAADLAGVIVRLARDAAGPGRRVA